MSIEDRMNVMKEDAKKFIREEEAEVGKGMSDWKRKYEDEAKERQDRLKRQKMEMR